MDEINKRFINFYGKLNRDDAQTIRWLVTHMQMTLDGAHQSIEEDTLAMRRDDVFLCGVRVHEGTFYLRLDTPDRGAEWINELGAVELVDGMIRFRDGDDIDSNGLCRMLDAIDVDTTVQETRERG